MTTENEPEKPANDHQHRNQLVAVAVASCLITLVIAIYLGAFSSKDYENLSDWLAVMVAAVATSISLYAVHLVAKTLKATQDTLTATVEMAKDQKKTNRIQERIGEAQVRPWVLMDSIKLDDPKFPTCVIFTFKNYGHTPASRLKVVVEHWIRQVDIDDDECRDEDYTDESLGVQKYLCAFGKTLAPGQPLEIISSDVEFDFNGDAERHGFFINWEYSLQRVGYGAKDYEHYFIDLIDGEYKLFHMDKLL